MESITEDSFHTRTGICIITAEHIMLKDGKGRALRTRDFRGVFPYIMYGLSSVMCSVYGVLSIIYGNVMPGVLYVLMGLFPASIVITGLRQTSFSPVIERSSILDVEAHPPGPSGSRGYITVTFRKGDTLQRQLLALPDGTKPGGGEYEHAVAVLRRNGLLDAAHQHGG